MSALQLTPKGTNYLRTDILFQQFNQNYITPTLGSNVVVNVPPKLMLDGSGRAYLTGSVLLTGGAPTKGDVILTFPKYLQIDQRYIFATAKLNEGLYTDTVLRVESPSSGISSVSFSNEGSYATLPTTVLTGPGSGATLVSHMRFLSATTSGNPTGNTSYAPGDTITLAGGTFAQASIMGVSTTGVYSAAVAAGGSGGTNGTQTVTGTTGTGTKFTASVTVAGGAITAVLSILTAGSYTVNPTSLAAEPVTGASLTGATLTVRMKPLTFSNPTPGNYEILPASPVAQSASSGTGVGATYVVLWKFQTIEVVASGQDYDSTSTITFTGGGSTGGAVATLNLLADTDQISVVLGQDSNTNDAMFLDGISFFVNSY